MKIFDFIKAFPDEESCKLKYKEIRDKQGVVCKECGSREHYWKQDKGQYECKKCKTRTTLKSGTIMHGSQLPFRYWFIAIHLLTSTKKSFSSKELQRQLGHKYYEPIWCMMHKIRMAMGERDGKYTLAGQIELDEGFFTTSLSEEHKNKKLKRGRGSEKKTKVLVMAESKEIETSTTKKGKPRRVGYIKMQVIPNLKADTITGIVSKNIHRESELITDDSTSYVKLKEAVDKHNPSVIPKEQIGEKLPWVHIAISNAKRVLLDIFHDIKPKFLQSYLNEFCYKFNRRFFGEALFDRLLVACATTQNEFRYRIR